jgi:hypothetical protein
MTEPDAGVPTLAPHELTYRVGLEIIELTADQATVRLRREPDPGDSDGIPQAVEAEVSVRGSSGHVTDKHGVRITPAIRVTALSALVELAYRDGHADMLDYPFLVTPNWKSVADPGEPEVCLMIRKRETFQVWFDELAQFDFADIERHMGRVSGSSNWFHLRPAAVQVLRELAAILPTIRKIRDVPHVLLHL